MATVMESQLATVLESSGLAEPSRVSLLETFGPSFVEARDLVAASAGIVVTDATQVSEMKAARAARMKIKAARVEVEKLRKATKDESLRFGQSVDRVAKMIVSLCEPEERRLEEAETFAERVEAKRKDELERSRREALSTFVPDVTIYPLRDMTEAAWAQLLSGSRAAFEAAAAAAAKAEADRLAAIEAKRIEDQRIREENARLAREAAEREAAAKAEREAAAAALKAEQDKARAERERLEAEARREREAREAAERKAKAEREAAELAREEEAARLQYLAELAAEEEARKAAAPDAEKVRAFAAAIMAVEAPEMTTKKGKEAMSLVLAGRLAFIVKVNAVADNLPEQAACGTRTGRTQ